VALDDWMKTAGAGRDIPSGVQNAANQAAQFAAQQAESLRRAQAAQQQAQQVMDQQNLSMLEARLVELTAQEEATMSAPRVVTTGGVGSKPIPVQHHLSEVLVALLPAAGGPTDIIPAARHLLATSPNLRNDAGFLERARESDAFFGQVLDRYGSVLHRINTPQWWRDVTVEAGLAESVTTPERWQGNYSGGVRDVVTTHVPDVIGIRVGEGGLRVRVTPIPGSTPADWERALDSLRGSFHNAGIDTDRLRVRPDSSGNVVLDFNDITAVEEPAQLSNAETVVSDVLHSGEPPA
jgi:hypothetical protein